MIFDELPKFKVKLMEYVATDDIRSDMDQNATDELIVLGEQARINRNCDIHKEKMYMIRLVRPPVERLIAVIFIEDMEGIRRNIIAYFDEVEHMLKNGFQNGDIKKFSGNPF